jgi:DNA polymerase III subunit gamma/tau
MTQALYNKWRPQKWDEIVGQQHVVQTLRNAVVGNRVVHAYLFAGPRGTGKTTAARLLAKAVNCLNEDPAARPCNLCAHCKAVNENRFLDLIEIDAASQTGVDDVRDLRDKVNFTPNQGMYKIYIIDEVHMFSNSAFNALLKTLEEPPPHAIFILATTEMHKIPATVLSRCQRHEFRRVPVDDIVGQLQKIVTKEKLNAEPEALRLIARQSAGGVRDAISLLDQMASTGKEITLGLTQTVLGTATSQTVIALVGAVLDREPAAGLEAIHTALDSGTDPRLLARQVVDYLRALLLVQMGNVSQVDLAADTRAQAQKHARALSSLDVLRLIKAFNIAATDLRGGWQPSLPLELALAEMVEAPKIPDQPVSPPAGKAPERGIVENQGTPTVSQNDMNRPDTQNIPQAKAPVILFQSGNPAEGVKKADEGTGDLSIDQLTKAWVQIRALIKPQDRNLEGLLNSCTLLEVKNGVLVIGLSSDILRSKVEIPEKIEITRKAISKVCNVDLVIKCVVSSARHPASPDVKAGGMVAAAIKHGGEIVDVQE